MYRRLFFGGIAAMLLISTGCCGAQYGCGGGPCGWYPGKVLGQAFACHGCGYGGYGGGCDGGCGGGCGGGCDGGYGGGGGGGYDGGGMVGGGSGCASCGGDHANWTGAMDGAIEPSAQAMPGPAYYPRAAAALPKPPAPPKNASSYSGQRGRNVRQTNYTQRPGNCQNGSCRHGRY